MLLEDHPSDRFAIQRFDQRIDHGAAHGPAAGTGSASAVIRPGDRAGDEHQQLFRLARQHGHTFTSTRFTSRSDHRHQRGRNRPAAQGTGAISRTSWPIPPRRMIIRIYDFLQFGGPIVDCPELHELAEVLAPREGRALGELALRHAASDRRQIHLQKGHHHRRQPDHRCSENRIGVCQDFTHLMIGLARALKIPARYVSGFIHPDAQRFPRLYADPRLVRIALSLGGWIGFDADQQLRRRRKFREGRRRPRFPRCAPNPRRLSRQRQPRRSTSAAAIAGGNVFGVFELAGEEAAA
jgi:hypothetical protein